MIHGKPFNLYMQTLLSIHMLINSSLQLIFSLFFLNNLLIDFQPFMDRWLLLFSCRYLFLWYRISFNFLCFFHICLLSYTSHSSCSALFLICYLLFPAFLYPFFFQTTKTLQIRQNMILHICQILPYISGTLHSLYLSDN